MFSDDGEWETVTSKSRQLKHAKSMKHFDNKQNDSDVKIPSGQSEIKTETTNSDLGSSAPPVTASSSSSSCLNSSSSYVNIVVDRLIGMEGMKVPVSGASKNTQDFFEVDGHVPKKVKFRSDVIKDRELTLLSGFYSTKTFVKCFSAHYHDSIDNNDEDNKLTAASETVLTRKDIEVCMDVV